MGNDRKPDGGGAGGSSRRGKKGGPDKPKQPQRGLGVAQLEKIRLHGQLGSGNFHPFLHNPYPSSSFHQDDIRAQAAAAAGYSSFPTSSFSYPQLLSPSAAPHAHNPHFLMGNDYEKASTRYDDAQPTNHSSWFPSNTDNVSEFQRPRTPTRNFSMEVDSQEMNRIGSCSRNSEDQELDLELRLSR
ncbi:hypothetical protein MLD38_006599 [Melastoma candidum]|uniref:Uncharacterized protein n=1 Tax=Melastoma candidum TaxID=119954 RepID=A0ACB9RSL1_9MYRT|nr:hypothetical protein MLD38_006599 [Melastoma candidum]